MKTEKDTSLVGCYICQKGYPLEDMHHRSPRGYICEDCQQQYFENWEEKLNKEPK